MLPEKLLHRLALTFVPNIGPKSARALLDHFGDEKDIFRASLKALMKIEGFVESRARALKESDVMHLAEKEMKFIEKQKIQPLFFTDENYPSRLKQCADAPVMLFYKGNADLDAEKIVAIVGTRKNTEYGQRVTEELIEGLQSQKNILITSGLALGIDAIAHKKSVKENIPTVGVLGHSLDRIYPFSHAGLAKEMVDCGGLLSEYPSGTKPDKENFPMRNRIVAGMSDVTVVIESDIKGGALITGYVAASYNREVAAFPGRVHDTRSAGCNKMIRKNIAAMITCADDLLELMNWQPVQQKKPVQTKLLLNLSDEEQKIIDILQQKDQVHADEILNQTGLSSTQLASNLLMLEMQGIVKTLPGKHYRMNTTK